MDGWMDTVGLQPDWFSTQVLLLNCYDFVKPSEDGLTLSCWNHPNLPWRRLGLMADDIADIVSSTHCQFSIIIEPLFESYNGMVSTASVDDLCRSTMSWLDQHCSLPALRPSESSSTDSSDLNPVFPLSFWWTAMTVFVIFLSGS